MKKKDLVARETPIQTPVLQVYYIFYLKKFIYDYLNRKNDSRKYHQDGKINRLQKMIIQMVAYLLRVHLPLYFQNIVKNI